MLQISGFTRSYLESSNSLKAFLALRDTDPAFAEIRGTERIGIPCIVNEAGEVAFEWDDYVSQDEA